MGSLSDYSEDALMKHILSETTYTPVATVYLGLSTADPLDTAAGLAEPIGNGYVRKAITFGAASSRAVTQSIDVSFDEATGPWGTLTHYALFDAETNGNMLAHGQLAASKSVISGNTPSVLSGEIAVSINPTAWSDYLANTAMDFMFRDQGFSSPSLYVALVETTEVTDADTGGTLNELDMTGYAREAVTAWNAVSAGASANTNLIDFGTLTGVGETVVSIALCDALAASTGNLLMYDNTVDQAVGDGDIVRIPAENFTVSLS